MTGVPSSQVSLHGEYGAPILAIVHLSFRFTCWICIYFFGNLMFQSLLGRQPYRLYEYPQPPCFYVYLVWYWWQSYQVTLCPIWRSVHFCEHPIVESPIVVEILGILAKSQDHRTPAPNTCRFPVAWVDRSWRVPHVGQEMSLFPEHPISLPILKVYYFTHLLYACKML